VKVVCGQRRGKGKRTCGSPLATVGSGSGPFSVPLAPEVWVTFKRQPRPFSAAPDRLPVWWVECPQHKPAKLHGDQLLEAYRAGWHTYLVEWWEP
jgi:hypothetical protein